MPKPELEFFPTDNLEWVPVEGSPPGHYQKILTEDPEKMFVTRLLKAEPGSASIDTFIHDFWEEVYILDGLGSRKPSPQGSQSAGSAKKN
jgi:hypothetical protein